MRIVNITAFPRPFSYATPSPGGVELKPGKESAELPVSWLLTNPLILADIDANIAIIRLSDDDRKLLNRALAEGDRKFIVANPPKKPVKPKRVVKAKPARKPVSVMTAAERLTEVPATAVPESKVKGGLVNLSDLQRGNTAVNLSKTAKEKADTIKKIRAHMGGLV